MPTIAGELKLGHVAGGSSGHAPLGIALASPLGGCASTATARAASRPSPCSSAASPAPAARSRSTPSLWRGDVRLRRAHRVRRSCHSQGARGHVDTHKLARANGSLCLAYTLGTAITVLTARTAIAPALGGCASPWSSPASRWHHRVVWLLGVTDRMTVSRHAKLSEVSHLQQTRACRRRR